MRLWLGTLLWLALVAVPATAQDAPTYTLDIQVLEDVVAGPLGTAAYLSPNGERVFYISSPGEVCIGTPTNPQAECIALPEELGALDPESAAWSLDSRYVAFTQDVFTFFVDSDVWLLDADTMTLRNLTDDGRANLPGGFSGEEVGRFTITNIDLSPSWTADGDLIFLRYSILGDNDPGDPEITRYDLDTDEVDGLGRIDTGQIEGPFVVISLLAAPSGERIAYNLLPQRVDEGGLFVANIDGEAPQLVGEPVINDERTGFYPLAFGPDERYLLAYNATAAQLFLPDVILLADLDAGTSEFLVSDPDADRPPFILGAGFGPNGELILTERTLADENTVLIATAPGGPLQRIAASQEFTLFAPTPRQRTPIVWGENNTVLLGSNGPLHVVTIEP